MVPTVPSSTRSTASGCVKVVGEESFAGDGPCLKPVLAEELGIIDGHSVAEDNAIVTAQVTSSASGPMTSGMATLVVIPPLGKGVTRLIVPPL